MSLFNSPSEPIRFQPRDNGPVFYLRQAVVRDRDLMLVAVGVDERKFNFWNMSVALKEAIERMEKSAQFEAEFDKWRELIELYETNVREAADRSLAENSDEAREAFREAFREPEGVTEIGVFARKWDKQFAQLRSEADAYESAYGVEAARHFLVGWEGKGLGRFERGATGASEASLFKLQPADLAAIGGRVRELLEPRPDVMGNSDLQSSTPSTETSPSSSGSRTARRGHPLNGKTSEGTVQAA